MGETRLQPARGTRKTCQQRRPRSRRGARGGWCRLLGWVHNGACKAPERPHSTLGFTAAAGAGGESRQRRPLRGGRLGRALSHQGGPRERPHFPACPAPTPEPCWATGSRRMRVEQRDPAGEAVRGGGHFGGASLRPVQLPRELSPGTRCGARGNPARIRRPGGAGPGTETRRGRPGRESREAAVTEQWQDTPRPPEPPSGAGAGRGSSRSDAVREPPAQGERAVQAHPGE